MSAMPTLAEPERDPRAVSAIPSRLRTRSAATARAALASATGRRIANSSPPSRARKSLARRRPASCSAAALISSSPAACPKASFTVVRRSRSSESRAAQAVASAAHEVGAKLLVEAAAVREARQVVPKGELAKLLLSALRLRDVGDGADVAGDPAVGRPQRHRPPGEPDDASVRAQVAVLERELAARAPRLGHRVAQRLAIIGMDGVEPPVPERPLAR